MKRSLILFLIILFSFHVHSIDYVQLSNVEINHKNQNGNLRGDTLQYQQGSMVIESQSPNIDFYFHEGLFQFQQGDINFKYDLGKENFLAGIYEMSSQGLSALYEKNKYFQIKNSGLLISHKGGTQYVPQFDVSCSGDAQKSITTDLAYQCLNLGRISLPLLKFDELSSKSVAKSFGLKNKGIDELEDISLIIVKKSFHLSFLARFLFKWKIKAKGSIDYRESESILDVHLDSAKVGIFSLKGKLLKELDDANWDSIQVKGDHILIQF